MKKASAVIFDAVYEELGLGLSVLLAGLLVLIVVFFEERVARELPSLVLRKFLLIALESAPAIRTTRCERIMYVTLKFFDDAAELAHPLAVVGLGVRAQCDHIIFIV